MGMMVDSCVFIAAERKQFDLAGFSAANDPLGFMSAITLSELLHGAHRAQTEAHKQARRSFIHDRLGEFTLVDFGQIEVETHAELTASLEKKGASIGSYDSLIAATALAHNWSVATLNVTEFQRVPNLRVIDASNWQLK